MRRPGRKAGDVMVYPRDKAAGDDHVIYVLLEDEPPDVLSIGCLCLVLDGRVLGYGPGHVKRFRGILRGSLTFASAFE